MSLRLSNIWKTLEHFCQRHYEHSQILFNLSLFYHILSSNHLDFPFCFFSFLIHVFSFSYCTFLFKILCPLYISKKGEKASDFVPFHCRPVKCVNWKGAAFLLLSQAPVNVPFSSNHKTFFPLPFEKEFLFSFNQTN